MEIYSVRDGLDEYDEDDGLHKILANHLLSVGIDITTSGNAEHAVDIISYLIQGQIHRQASEIDAQNSETEKEKTDPSAPSFAYNMSRFKTLQKPYISN